MTVKPFYEQLAANDYFVSRLNNKPCEDCVYSRKPVVRSNCKQCSYYQTPHKERNLVNKKGHCNNFVSKF